MQTTLFNIHEISIDNKILTIEFYAGDIFDIYTDILLLSAFKGGFAPVRGTTWGSLSERTGLRLELLVPDNQQRLSENIVLFKTPKNKFFDKLLALEMTDLLKRNSFTIATLRSRYREVANLLESFPGNEEESVSMPILGTGNQGISLEDSVNELLHTISCLQKTNLKIVRVFAYNFESIGILNQKINAVLNRNEAVHSNLLDAALEELEVLSSGGISALSSHTIERLKSLSGADHISLNTFGITGRQFAENVVEEFIKLYHIEPEESAISLHQKIQAITPKIITDRPYVISYLRLLQNYGNQAAHSGNPNLNHQDAAAVIIAIVRIIDFYETRIAQ